MNKALRAVLILVGVIIGTFILFYLYGTSVYSEAVVKQEGVKKNGEMYKLCTSAERIWCLNSSLR